MNINKLILTNYRSAQSLSLDLHPRLNVFVGVNGSGKSSILDATAIMLSWIVNRLKQLNASGRPITERDITNGKSSAKLEVVCTHDNRSISWIFDQNT